MSDHNFLIDDYDINVAILEDCKGHISQIVLPSDPVSQFDNFHMMERLEINAVNAVLGVISQIFEGQSSAVYQAKQKVCTVDTSYALKLTDSINDISQLSATINAMTDIMNVSLESGVVFLNANGAISIYDNIVEILNNTVCSIYSKDTFEIMTDTALDSYCKALMGLDADNLSEEEKAHIQALKEYLISNKTNKFVNEVVCLHELLYGEINIKTIDKSPWTDFSEKRYINAKYLVCCEWSNLLISKFFTERIRCFSTSDAETAFVEFGENDCIRQGNFDLCNLSVTHTENGEAKFVFDARQHAAKPCDGAVIVYDKKGNIIQYAKLEKYERPTNLVEVIKQQADEWNGKDYAETHIEVAIPQGGFVEVTDDPTIIETVPLLLQSQQIEFSSQDVLELSQSLSDGMPDLINSVDVISLGFDIVGLAGDFSNDAEAKIWSKEESYSGSFVLYNYNQ